VGVKTFANFLGLPAWCELGSIFGLEDFCVSTLNSHVRSSPPHCAIGINISIIPIMVPNPFGNRHRDYKSSSRPIFTHRTANNQHAISIFASKKQRAPPIQKKHAKPAAVGELENLLLAESTPARRKTRQQSQTPLLVPLFALDLVQQCDAASRRLNQTWTLCHAAVLFLTVSTVTAAVLYGVVYGSRFPCYTSLDCVLPNWKQWSLYGGTVALPCLCARTVLLRRAVVKRGNPYPRLKALLVSELFHFRARVPPYQKEKPASLQALVQRLRQLYETQVLMAAKDPAHTLDLAEDFWTVVEEPAKDDGATEIAALMAYEAIRRETSTPTSTNFEYFDESLAYLPSIAPAAAVSTATTSTSDGCDVEAQTTSKESTPLLSNPDKGVAANDSKNNKNNNKPKALVDDGRSPLSPSAYAMLRLESLATAQKNTAASLSRRQHLLESTTTALTLSTSAMAVVSLQWAVPIVLAVAAAAQQGLDLSFAAQQQAVAARDALERIRAWWKTVQDAGDQDWQLKRLVQETEAVVVAATI